MTGGGKHKAGNGRPGKTQTALAVLEGHTIRAGIRDMKIHCLCGETFEMWSEGASGGAAADGHAAWRVHVAEQMVKMLGIESMQKHIGEQHRLLRRMDALLTRTANVLKGQPDELEWHDWSDLPEVAAALMEKLQNGHRTGTDEDEDEDSAGTEDETTEDR
jgi:hypothetical protein